MQNDKFRRKYNIVCAIDDNYVPLCGIMLTSLFESNPNHHIVVYILTQGLKQINIRRLQDLVKNRTSEIHICEIPSDFLNNIPINFQLHFNISICYRLLMANILPNNIDKVLYLDCDILIRGDISQLYDIDINEYALAACPEHDGEIGIIQSDMLPSIIKKLGYQERYGYFNSGVLLINLEYWRTNQIGERAIEYIARHHENCIFVDQDALNAILYDKKKLLPCKYNILIHLFNRNRDIYTRENPIIVHYSSPTKPWDWFVLGYPFQKEWEHYRRISPWRWWRGNAPLNEKIKRIIYNIYLRLRGRRRLNINPAWKIWGTK